MKIRPQIAVAVALVFSAEAARANDEVFRLKNGRAVSGDLVEETYTDFVVRVGDGSMTLEKDAVAAVEQGLPRRAPPPPPVETSPSPVARSVERVRERVGVGSAADPLPGIDAAVEQLARVRHLEATEPGWSETRRREVLGSIRARVPVEALVAVIASASAAENIPGVRALALELVLGAGARARPSLARAAATSSLALGPTAELVAAIGAAGDDEGHSIEDALGSRVEAALAEGYVPRRSAPTLAAIGTTRSLPRLYALVLAGELRFTAHPLADAARAIVERQPDPDAALEPLLARLDARSLPETWRIERICSILAASPRRAVVKLADVVRSLEEGAPNPAREPREFRRASRRAVLHAVAAIATEEAVDLLLARLDEAWGEERADVLDALATVRPREGRADPSVASALLERMAAPTCSPAAREDFARVLHAVTGESFGTNVAAWRAFLDRSAARGPSRR